MNIEDIKWGSEEKKEARKIFELALKREMEEIKKILRDKIENINDTKNIWEIEKFLTTRRKFIESKYDYRYSKLLIVFGILLKEGYLTKEDILGLDEKKQIIIKHFAE